MSAVDISVAAAMVQINESPVASFGSCENGVDSVTAVNLLKFEFAETTGRAGHEALTAVDSQPLPGSASAIAELWGPWVSAEFRLIDDAGVLIDLIAMSSIDDQYARVYWSGTVDVPNTPFRIAVAGTDSGGTPFDITCSYLFQPQTVSVKFDTKFQYANPGPVELTALVINHGPADTFDISYINDVGLPVTGLPAQVELAQGAEALVTLTVDIPSISTGTLDVKAKVVAQGTANSSVKNYGVAVVRSERFNYLFGDGFDSIDPEEGLQ